MRELVTTLVAAAGALALFVLALAIVAWICQSVYGRWERWRREKHQQTENVILAEYEARRYKAQHKQHRRGRPRFKLDAAAHTSRLGFRSRARGQGGAA